MASLPYVTAPGNVDRALLGIKQAATPPTVSQDFVKTILGIKGGSGNQMTAYLRKIGFAGADGSPSSIYTRFRNPDPDVSGVAMAEALKLGYAALYARNEYMHSLTDEKLKGLIIEETGAGGDSVTATMIVSCIKALKKYAVYTSKAAAIQVIEAEPKHQQNGAAPNSGTNNQGNIGGAGANVQRGSEGIGLNLAYTINLNLPATSDIAVFNAIFKSLKENLLKDANG
jgi:Family of unknown function (DUF5343)